MKRIFSLILVLMAVQMMWGQTQTFKVTNTEESGEGSLSSAIKQIHDLVENKQINFEIVFELDEIGDITINLSESLDFLSEDHELIGYLSIDGSTYSEGNVVLSISNRMQFFGQRITFKNIHFVGVDKGTGNVHSPSFLCNRMGSVIFENCSFKNFNKSYFNEDALFANTENGSSDYYSPLINCKQCSFENCKVFKHQISGSTL